MSRISDNKKGGFSFLIGIMLLLAGAIAVLIVLTSFNVANNMEEAVGICKTSVVAQRATSIGVIDKDSPFNLNCEKRYVDFYNNKVELGLSPKNMHRISVDYGDTTTKKFMQLNEYVVNQVIAEELRVCKTEFGDGQIDLFPNEDNFFPNKKICFICSEINFKPGVKKQNFTHLKEYTTNTIIQSKDMSYYEYLTTETRYNDSMWFQGTLPDDKYNITIDTSESYLVYLQKYSAGAITKAAQAFLMGQIATMQYAFLLRAQDSITIGVVPAKDINYVCDVQAN